MHENTLLVKVTNLSCTSVAATGQNNFPVRAGYKAYLLNIKHPYQLQAQERQQRACSFESVCVNNGIWAKNINYSIISVLQFYFIQLLTSVAPMIPIKNFKVAYEKM